MIRHLLVAHDLTPEADVALARAAQLARQHDARVSLLHVYDPGLSASAVKTVSAMLQLKRKEAGLDEDSAIHLFRGQPIDGILQQTRALEPDLLLMGAHHQKTFERFGNTTLDQVVRRSRVPVLLAVREADEPYSQALSALDFSQCACTALRQAYRLLPVEADLHALHVFESPDDGVLGLPRQNAAHLATQAGLIEQLLSDEQERLPGVGPQLSHEVVPGVLPYSLDAALKQRQPELLALGRHSRNALMQALLGNLAQRYLRQPSCDVLVTS
ncbi:universal stress protein [Pseudomonas aeruginosa]|uniref:universal stress protein n=1 Tax=Pseudomonas aeruginosa TaxID=287 RepID=UPI000F53C34D|nr:universal stress protein [Pseudomonas aeruginosa]RPX17161.1 universal stress protein [Pseudomonas aeruginosa]RPX79198.1 universal stress protein [Pseudomonas aeruginosa]WCW24815.1 universal stress protein [Pseudomonas aeruginosa]HEJ6036022.1 universal stress protein [Pseudomonas aeruginosa]